MGQPIAQAGALHFADGMTSFGRHATLPPPAANLALVDEPTVGEHGHGSMSAQLLAHRYRHSLKSNSTSRPSLR